MYRKKNSRFIKEDDIIVFNVLKRNGSKKVVGPFLKIEISSMALKQKIL